MRVHEICENGVVQLSIHKTDIGVVEMSRIARIVELMREWSPRVDGLSSGLLHSFGASDELCCAWIGFRSLPTCAAHEDLPYLAGRTRHVRK